VYPRLAGLCCLIGLLGMACQPAAPVATSPSAPAAVAQPAAQATAPRPLQVVKVGVLAPQQAAAGIYVALEQGYFRERGLDVELVQFTRGVEMVPALSTSQLQAGTGSAGAAMFNAVNQGITNKVVADEGSTQPGAGGTVMMYRRDLVDDGSLTRPEQVRGRRIALSGFDAVQEFIIMAQIVPHLGLQPSDVELVAIPFPDMAAALANRQVDAALTLEPFASTIAASNAGVRGLTSGEVKPGTQMGTLLYGEEFTHDREAANGFMVAYVKALRDHNDALFRRRNVEPVLAALMQHQAIPSREAVESMTLVGLNPNGYVYEDSLAAMQEYFVAKGSVKQPVSMSAVVDNSFVDHAIRALGEYR
jgi:ABC-type nitrate/sulfonate/bicarbonate transport system substrate-binding protein